MGIRDHFARLDATWKTLAVLASAVAVGVTGGFALTALVEAPQRIEDNAAAIAVNAEEIRLLKVNREKVTADIEDVRDGIAQLQCLVIASRRDTPIEDCL